ncbi:MAG: transposase [Microcystis sp. M54BS1]|uniref:transposase n=1 Tax=unclassified Microcystis TaxID=2643300 RepID=UPI00257E4A71|nr:MULTISPECIES: transposase [unclassified Microcystis]MCA2541402.1 transposase [Microcystis sp. M54BS1]MCA2594815.1 transposase [Microcystis sp. M38BS1]MCA2609635.1 transposase [Microcystis sp. M27BS1]MCA2505687.1 transposase [Microcystis sp. M62BS1]MCA2511794.1 transposase [Microcystis sp. M60BS1]
MFNTFLSIVIPMREGFGEHWLGELLKVKGDIEFILVHPPGVKPSPVNDPRMKQIVCALRGEIIQRSTGFLNARGTYILTINCDEYLHPEIVTLVKDYFERFPNSWVLRLARCEFPYGEREKLESTWPTIPDVNSLAICSRRENNSNLFKDNNYLLELPIAPLDNPFNPQVFLNQRRDQNGPHLENFDKKVWKSELVQAATIEITNLMNLLGPIKYIPFWCLDRLLGLYIQAKYFEKERVIGHWMPNSPEQIRIEDNPPEYQRTWRFYFLSEVMLLRKFPQYGYLWNLAIYQFLELPAWMIKSLRQKIIPSKSV